MKPYKISIIVSMVFVSIGTVISVLAPTYLAKLTDAAAAVLVGSPLGIDISKELETVMF
jgi:ABC-type multidrug transport system fused ATPase/permease subunit